VGGAGTLIGPIFGGAFFLFLEHQLSEITDLWPLIFGSLFIGFVLLAPQGIFGIVAGRLRRKELRAPGGGEEAPDAAA